MPSKRLMYRFCQTMALLVVALVVASCAPALKHMYADQFLPEDSQYENRIIGFFLTYEPTWHIITHPSTFTGTMREFAGDLQKKRAELLFAGTTVDNMQGTRGIAINTGLSPQEYAAQIIHINEADISENLGTQDMLLGTTPCVKWQYRIKNYRFVEYFFEIRTVNVRIAFWTNEELFNRFEPTYTTIIGSLSLYLR